MLTTAVQLGRDPFGHAARVAETLAQRVRHCLELSRAEAGEGAGLALLLPRRCVKRPAPSTTTT